MSLQYLFGKLFLLMIVLFICFQPSLTEAKEILIELEKEFTVCEVESIKATCTKAFNSPQEFEGEKIDFGDPCDPQTPGQALVIFFKDVVDANLQVQPFDVTLEAKIKPEISEGEFSKSELWSKTSTPKSDSSFDKKDTFKVKLKGLRGGRHKIRFKLSSEFPESGAEILLPLAGAEVKDWIKADMARGDAWVQKVKAKYKGIIGYPRRYVKAFEWFWAPIDYSGCPTNPSAPSCSRFNESASGMSICTWFGVPVGVPKLSNFMFGYLTRKLKLLRLAVWVAQMRVGTPDDAGSRASTQAGWDVAGGASYESTMKEKVKEIHKGTVESDNKTKKLWPNYFPATGGLNSPSLLNSEP